MGRVMKIERLNSPINHLRQYEYRTGGETNQNRGKEKPTIPRLLAELRKL